jgi:stringent starvation protein B
MTTAPLRAHLLRATHAWLSENGHTPYVQVLVDRFVQVPVEYVQGGSIVLNISWDSTNKLQLGDQWIEFQARFNGQVRTIMFPVDHVVSLFSKESQEGYQAMTGDELIAIRDGQYQLPEDKDADVKADASARLDAPAEAPAPETPPRKPSFTRVK